MKYFFYRKVNYKNGKLNWVADSPNGYNTKAAAIEAAHSEAAHYARIFGAEFQHTVSGAIFWFADGEGNRYRTEYTVLQTQ